MSEAAPQSNLFTAAVLSAALGKTPQAIRKALDTINPAGIVMVRGKETVAWKILQLPQPWIVELDKNAVANGFGNGEQFLKIITDGKQPAAAPARKIQAAPALSIVVDEIPGLNSILEAAKNRNQKKGDDHGYLNRWDREGIWNTSIKRYKELLGQGITSKRAAKRIREILFRQVPQLTPSRNAMLKLFKRELADNLQHGGSTDLRNHNGNRFTPPQGDIDILRHSTAHKNGGRFDAAWREEYLRLSEYTRHRYALSHSMPEAMRVLVNRELTDAVADRHHGKRTLKRRIGGVTRDWSGMRSMKRWVVDDLTNTIECELKRAGASSLILPQIVAVMDSASRKFTGWEIAPIKAPTAELAVLAFENAIQREKAVPSKLGVENGFVFGNSLNVNGKVDSEGRTITAGLAKYGCTITHFEKMNPGSKGELEKAFDLVQRLFERHPGYTGRVQMLNAPEDFKLEQRKIRSGKMEAIEKRYTYEECCAVIDKCFEEYNATPREVLNGFSPNEIFELRRDHCNPPITLTAEMMWLLSPSRYLVRVKAGGVSFSHYGRKIVVRGEALTKFIGVELRAVMRHRDDDLVSFITKDYSHTFTMEICRNPSPDESSLPPESRVLAGEKKKIGEHIRAINIERERLIGLYGDPRKELLAEIRSSATRPTYVNPRMVESALEMDRQREEIQARKTSEAKERKKKNRIAHEGGLIAAAVADPAALERINALLSND